MLEKCLTCLWKCSLRCKRDSSSHLTTLKAYYLQCFRLVRYSRCEMIECMSNISKSFSHHSIPNSMHHASLPTIKQIEISFIDLISFYFPTRLRVEKFFLFLYFLNSLSTYLHAEKKQKTIK